MKQLFLFGCLLLTLISNAQLRETFKKGWFINKDNLKTEGHIRADDLSKLLHGICFKTSLDVKKCQVYSTNDLKSFQIGDSNTFDLLGFKMNNKELEVELFLKLITKGNELSLYKGILKSETFFVLSKNGKNHVLQNDKLISGEIKVRTYYYKQTLNLITEGLVERFNRKVKFDEDYFVQIVTEYNVLKNAEVSDLRTKERAKNYLLANIGYGKDKNVFQYYGQVLFRKYVPKISRNTSLNVGVNYFTYQSEEQNRNFTRSLLTIPLHIQHNLLDKKIRPYIFTGFSFYYKEVSHENSKLLTYYEPEKEYNLFFLLGAGIEIDVLNNIYLKAEYRNEVFSHPIMFGIGYILDFKNK